MYILLQTSTVSFFSRDVEHETVHCKMQFRGREIGILIYVIYECFYLLYSKCSSFIFNIDVRNFPFSGKGKVSKHNFSTFIANLTIKMEKYIHKLILEKSNVEFKLFEELKFYLPIKRFLGILQRSG